MCVQVSEVSNGWQEYKRLVLDRIDKLEQKVSELSDKVGQLTVAIESMKAEMKVKTGIWSVVASLATVLTVLALAWLKTNI